MMSSLYVRFSLKVFNGHSMLWSEALLVMNKNSSVEQNKRGKRRNEDRNHKKQTMKLDKKKKRTVCGEQVRLQLQCVVGFARSKYLLHHVVKYILSNDLIA